jgi:polysaccharide export outer membrane protein
MQFKIRPSVLKALIIVFLISSCATRKDVVYLQDTGNYETLVDNNEFTNKFKVDDLISIYISSLDPEASAPFNLFRGSSEGGFRPEQVDYLVDQAGMIDFPVIGQIRVQGLTPDELRELIKDKLSEYLKDPIINIRLRNFSVTILGSVARPGTYPVNGEQVTILEALGLAGDMTPRGERTNVLVIRDFNGNKVYSRIDLTSKSMTKSPVYYLTQNDVVYVEPNRTGIKETSIGTNVNLTFQVISLLVTTSVILLTRL